MDLPQAGNSGLGFQQSAAMPGGIGFNFIRHRRTRSDQRHFSAQHVDKLRQFVEAGAPQEIADLGDAGIVGKFEHSLGNAVGRILCGLASNQLANVFLVLAGIVVDVHGTEFEKGKRRSVFADALLPEQNRSARRQLDGGGNQEENRREQRQQDQAARHVHHSFDATARRVRIVTFVQVRIKCRITGPLRILRIPLLREEMKRKLELAELLEREPIAQHFADAGENRAQDEVVVRSDFREHHAHHGVRLVPAHDVGFPGRRLQGGEDLEQQPPVLVRG